MTWNELLADPTVATTYGWIDVDYYKDVYCGETTDTDEELTKLIVRASDDVNAAAEWRIDEDIADMPTVVKNLIYKATAAQTEWYVLNGETYNDDDSTSVTISKFSYGSRSTQSSSKSNNPLCRRAMMYLSQTGLMYRGIC